MKLLFYFLFVTFMTANATGLAQNVTLSGKNLTLKEIFTEVKKQTGYVVFYKKNDFEKTSRISISVQEMPLVNVLDAVFKDQPLSYLIEGKTIVISPRNVPADNSKNEVSASEGVQPPQNITGKVVDSTGSPVADASVRLTPGNKGTSTGRNGQFLIAGVAPGNYTIEISSIGFESIRRSITVAATAPLALPVFVLRSSSEAMSSVEVTINTGYQSISRERATGAYDVVGQEILSKRPVSNLSTALQGLVAGMQATENEDGSVDFLIRGNSSMYADRAPLVVLDGFPLSSSDFSTINPNDVESVTVLKDAAAASIWGARSGNGVIVVTTKKAKRGQKVNIDANVFTRITKRTDLQQLLANASSTDQIRFERLAYANKWTIGGTEYQGGVFPSDVGISLTLAQELMYANQYGQLSNEAMNAGLDSLARISNFDQIQDHLLRRGVLNQYNISLSHASERTRTLASIMYENNKTRFQGTGHDRFVFNFNNEYRPAEFITFNLGLYLQYHKQENDGATISELRQLSPYETLLNPDGSYSVNLIRNRALIESISGNGFPYSDWSYNLLREVRGRDLRSESYNARIQTGFNVKLLRGLSFDAKFQYERGKTEVDNYYSDETYYVRNMVNSSVEYNHATGTVGRMFLPVGGIGQPSQSDLQSYVLRSQLNFQRTIGVKHAITAIAGGEISQTTSTGITSPWLYGYYPDLLRSSAPLYGYGSAVERFPSFTSGTTANTTLSGGNTSLSYGLDRFVSYFGNGAYTYDGKYTLSGSIRADASNFIAEDPSIRWSPLWSVGGMWNAKMEEFLSGVTWLDQLRVRATYGKNGNVEKSTSTKTLLNVGTALNTSTGTITATISSYGNPMLSWEKTATTNIGIDFAVLKRKLFGKLDFYNKKGEDITGSIALPGAAGTTSQRFNNAGIINRGIELELGTQIGDARKGWSYGTSLTYAYNFNQVLSLRAPRTYPYLLSVPSNAFVEGKPINPVYSYTYLGVENGMPQIAGDNKVPVGMNTTLYVTGNAFDVLTYQGTATPPHTLGWLNNIDYKNVSLTFLFVGKFGGVYRNPTFNYGTAAIGSIKTIVNQFVGDVFAGREDIPPFPAPNESRHNLWSQYTNYLSSLVESSSYIECKEVSLNYTLPHSLLGKMSMRNVRVYAQMRDLGLVYAANKNNYNPDWLPGTNRPLPTFTLGINLGL
ncbi:MAG: SusC/RagA family TonB-linked outer membrane protein [Chitinophagaceae bacterium]